ncbi:MAG TPA: threonine/serine dehydratase [Ktedonobacterales bacterium]
MTETNTITPASIEAAAERLRGRVRRTPVERSNALSAQTGAEVWLKLECFQETGSFKLRGALNRLLTLDDAARARGVVTASAGSHGLGVAEASARMGVRATVVVPETAAPAKLRGLEAYRDRGIELIVAGRDYDAAEARGLTLARTSGRTWVSPYNDAAVIAGNGTVAREVLADVGGADMLIVPAGGGGLIGGCGVWAKHIRPDIRVVGVQPEASATLRASLQAGRLVNIPVHATLADSLAGNIEADSITFPLAQRVVDDVVVVSEREIADAMRWLLAEHHILVEGSAATALAVLLARKVDALTDQRIVVVLTGRNVGFETVRAVVCAG